MGKLGWPYKVGWLYNTGLLQKVAFDADFPKDWLPDEGAASKGVVSDMEIWTLCPLWAPSAALPFDTARLPTGGRPIDVVLLPFTRTEQHMIRRRFNKSNEVTDTEDTSGSYNEKGKGEFLPQRTSV